VLALVAPVNAVAQGGVIISPVVPVVNPDPLPWFLSIWGSGTFELGAPATLQVTGAPDGATYQWSKGGAAIAGATASTYKLTALSASDGGTYGVEARLTDLSATATTQLTVKAAAAPSIVSPPLGATRVVGQSVTFSVEVSGSYPRTFQWKKDSANMPGATAATLSLTPLSLTDAGQYAVTVTNPYGAVTSSGAALTVNPATAPVFSAGQPADGSYTEGTATSQTIRLRAGSEPISYQWRKDGAAIAGATTATLGFASIRASDARTYSCVATNVAGSDTSRGAVITVTPATPIAIVTQPESRTVYATQSAQFAVSVTGSQPITYQWYKDGAALNSASNSTYTLYYCTAQDAGKYRVVAHNAAGDVASADAVLTVNPQPLPVITQQPAAVTIAEGEPFGVTVRIADVGYSSYQWYRDGQPIPYGNSSYFTAMTADASNAGKYHVVVTNATGSTQSDDVVVTVLPPPPPPILQLASTSFRPGQSCSLSDGIFRPGSAGTYFQWYKDGVAIDGATATVYAPPDSSSAAGDYYVLVSNRTASTPSLTAHVTQLTPDTAGGWMAAQRGGDIVYFAFANPARIERYNLATQAWLAPWPLRRAPTAMRVASDGVWVADGATLSRLTLDAGAETLPSMAFPANVTILEVAGGYLVVGYSSSSGGSRLLTVKPSTGDIAATMDFSFDQWYQLAAAPNGLRLFGHPSTTQGLQAVDVLSNGPIGRETYASETSSTPHGRFVTVSPDGSLVLDDSGVAFAADTLRWSGSVCGAFDDVVFIDNSRLAVLRGRTVHVYDHLAETGRFDAGMAGKRIFVRGDVVFVFGAAPVNGVIPVTTNALSAATSLGAGGTDDMTSAPYAADATFLDRNGVLYLLSKANRQLFRWSPDERRPLSPIGLQSWPNKVAYSATTHRIYVAYGDSRVTQIRLDEGSVEERPFYTSIQRIDALTCGGQYVIVSDTNTSISTRWTAVIAPDGTVTKRTSMEDASFDYEWVPSLRRLYHFRDWLSPNDLIVTTVGNDGSLASRDSPYHGDPEMVTRYPIRVSPDQRLVLLGSGRFYDAETLRLTATALPNRIDDAFWSGGTLYTARTTTQGTELQQWDPAYAVRNAATVPERLIRIYPTAAGRVLTITGKGGLVHLRLFGSDLAELAHDVTGAGNRLANLTARSLVGRDAEMLTPGFVITGAQPRKILVRAIGPSLTQFGVQSPISDPRLIVLNSARVQVAGNEDWENNANLAELRDVSRRLGAFPLTHGSKDAALLVTLPPGLYSAQASDAAGVMAVGLVEVYDAEGDRADSRLVNIAARARVGAGEDVLIAGFVVYGAAPRTVLIRGIGPSLAAFGIPNSVSRPKITLYHGSNIMAENGNWRSGTTEGAQRIVYAAQQTGAFALAPDSNDAAMLVSVPAGQYTVHLSSTDGSGGIGMVEVYELP
jgi:hypothetical protein